MKKLEPLLWVHIDGDMSHEPDVSSDDLKHCKICKKEGVYVPTQFVAQFVAEQQELQGRRKVTGSR